MKSQLFRFLSVFVWFFSALVAEEDLSQTNLDSYLRQHGFYLSPVHSTINEGYSSEKQRQAFKEEIRKSPQIKAIAEIGFNAGHSCEAFLESSNDIEVTTFDINFHPYTKIGVEFMKKKYRDRFNYIEGNSLLTVKQYAESSGKKFDLIFIDGGHDFNTAYGDICNCQRLAHENTVVWIDDYDFSVIQSVVNKCVQQGLIEVINSETVNDKSGLRSWVKVKYDYLSEAEKFFDNVYDRGVWGRDKEGRGTSGSGSTIDAGKPFVQFVQDFLDKHDIQSVVDLGCGDWVLDPDCYPNLI